MTDQRAIVTGGTKGTGAAVTEQLAGRGARVAIWDMDETLARQAADRVGGAIAIARDISDWGMCRRRLARPLGPLMSCSIPPGSPASSRRSTTVPWTRSAGSSTPT